MSRARGPHPFLRRLLADEDGAALVEFAFVLLPMMVLLLGGMDFAYQAYIRAMLQGALNDVARSSSMETVSLECDEGTVEENLGCALRERSDTIALGATYDIQVRNFFDYATVGRSEKLVTDYNANGHYNTGDCFVDLNRNNAFDQDAGRTGVGGADDVVFYEVTLSAPRLFPWLGAENYEIVAETAIRNQPYARQQTPPTVCV